MLLRPHLDPRGAVLPAGQDPASTLDTYGPAVLMGRLTGAEPMGRQVVEPALGNRELTWAEDKIAFAHEAAGILSHASPSTWEREVAAVTERTGLDVTILRMELVDTIETDTDDLGRLAGRNRRDDLDRGQHVQATPAQLAAMSTGRTGAVRPAQARAINTTSRPAHALATAKDGPTLIGSLQFRSATLAGVAFSLRAGIGVGLLAGRRCRLLVRADLAQLVTERHRGQVGGVLRSAWCRRGGRLRCWRDAA